MPPRAALRPWESCGVLCGEPRVSRSSRGRVGATSRAMLRRHPTRELQGATGHGFAAELCRGHLARVV